MTDWPKQASELVFNVTNPAYGLVAMVRPWTLLPSLLLSLLLPPLGAGLSISPRADHYRQSTPIVRPATVPLQFKGDGWGTSELYWPNDLGAGTFGIDFTGTYPTGASKIFHQFSDLSFRGPGTSFVEGTSPANMHGVLTMPYDRFTRCYWSRFKGGMCIRSHHESFVDCIAELNYDNVYFIGAVTGHADDVNAFNQSFVNCMFSGALRSSVACAPGEYIGGATFYQTHLLDETPRAGRTCGTRRRDRRRSAVTGTIGRQRRIAASSTSSRMAERTRGPSAVREERDRVDTPSRVRTPRSPVGGRTARGDPTPTPITATRLKKADAALPPSAHPVERLHRHETTVPCVRACDAGEEGGRGLDVGVEHDEELQRAAFAPCQSAHAFPVQPSGRARTTRTRAPCSTRRPRSRRANRRRRR